ncbi:MAG: hypothetical protein K2X91_12250, partial [Thermoleophilia bacterium]|nr:hypothetical protein [Thermoleophilia bacterium]
MHRIDPIVLDSADPQPELARGRGRGIARPVAAGTLPGDGAILTIGQLSITALYLLLSPLALILLGWQYADTGGSPIEKF